MAIAWQEAGAGKGRDEGIDLRFRVEGFVKLKFTTPTFLPKTAQVRVLLRKQSRFILNLLTAPLNGHEIEASSFQTSALQA